MQKLTNFPSLQASTIQSFTLGIGATTAACLYYILQERIIASCIDKLSAQSRFDTPKPSLYERSVTTFYAFLICLPPLH
jgi:hypothetical protein